VIRGHLQRKAYATLKASIPILIKALYSRVARDLLYAKKIQADKDAELDALEKKRQEEELARKQIEEETERQRALEEDRRRQALLENPGFKIIGLRQENVSTKSSDAIPTEGDSQYNYLKYAAAYFRADQTLSHSPEPVVGALLSKLNEEESSKATSLHISIQSFVHATSRADEIAHTKAIFALCAGSIRLMDELFASLMKCTFHNINAAETLRGWYLLALCLGCLSPSDDIEKYLANYIISRGPEGNASFCIQLFRGVKSGGQRVYPPCSLEYDAALHRTPISVKIFFPSGESAPLQVFPSTTVADACMQAGYHLKFTSTSGFSVTADGVFLGDKEFLLDIFSGREDSGLTTDVALSFQKQLFMPQEPRSSQHITFVSQQISKAFLEELIPTTTEKDAVQLAALLFLSAGGRKEQIAALDVTKILPQSLLSWKSPKDWRDAVAPVIEEFLPTVSDEATAKGNLIDLAEKLPLFFGKVFTVKQVDPTPLSSTPFFVMVNTSGIQVVQIANGKKVCFLLLFFLLLFLLLEAHPLR